MFPASHLTPHCNVHKSVRTIRRVLEPGTSVGNYAHAHSNALGAAIPVTRGLRRPRTTERDSATITLVQRSVSVPPGAKE
jgi:hypothetical protein